jgi:peptidyl-prolyl cis-trans isomerase C
MGLKISINEGARALVFSFTLAMLLSGCFSQERALLNKTVLSINGKDITAKEYADRLALRLKAFDALYAKDEANLDRAKEDTVQAYLLEFIAKDYAAKNGIKVDKKEVDDQVAEIKSKYPDDFAFRRAFADENLSIEKWRQDLEFTILQKKIFAIVTAKAPEPTEAEVKAYYEAKKTEFQQPARVRLRQVVLEKEDDAKRIMDELNNGANLEHLARKFSIAPEGAQGGDTGWLDKGTLEVFDQAFKIPVGQRSKILKSPYGWHIYEVLKKEPEARLSFDAAKARIRTRLKEAATQKVFVAWLEEQVRKSSVKRNDGVIRAIKVTTRGS